MKTKIQQETQQLVKILLVAVGIIIYILGTA